MQRNLIWTLKQLNLSLDQYGRKQMKEMGVSPAQGGALCYLLSQKDKIVYATDLHTALGISKSSISATLKALKQKGYLQMVDNPSDDRKKQIVLTDKAYEMEKRIYSSFLEQQKHLCRTIPEQNLAQLENDLNVMLYNIKKEQV